MSKYQLFQQAVPPLGTNCYLLVDESSRTAAVIDPGGAARRIYQQAQQAGAEIRLIINSHGHWDHVGANRELKELTGAEILIHELDASMLTRPALNMGRELGGDGLSPGADRLLREGEVIRLGELELTVLHTPGHTLGGICLLCEDLLFTGDTMFQLSCGRTDLPGGDDAAITDSLARLAALPGDLQVLPGHGPASHLDYERKYNPYVPRN